MKWLIDNLEIQTSPCQKSDRDFVLSLIKKTLFPYVAKYYKPSIKMFDDRFSKDYKERKILLRGKRRIGFFQLKKTNKRLIINGLFLSPSYQGKGIGKFLMTYFEMFAQKNKLKNIELQIWDNNPAKDFYKKNGYKIVIRKNHKY